MTPTQEDREAAAEWSFGRTDFASFSPADRFEVEEVAKFIAGIRLAAEERGARMALEAAAKVADENKWPDKIVDASWAGGDITPSVHNQACEEVATAIRQIDPAALAKVRETHHLIPKDQEPVWTAYRDGNGELYVDSVHIEEREPNWEEVPLYALEKRHD